MIEASLIFRLLVVVILIVFAVIFTGLFLYDRKEKASAWIAVAFTFGLLAFASDLGRLAIHPLFMDILAKLFLWSFSIAWVIGIKEYCREKPQLDQMISVSMGGLFFVLWFSFVDQDIIARSISSTVVAGLLLCFCLLTLWQKARGPIERTLFFATAALCASYFLRPIIVYAVLEDTHTASSYGSSTYAALLHASSAFFAMACGSTMLLALGHKIIEKYIRKSVRDPLTNLLNRRGLEEYVAEELDGSKGRGRAIAIIDLDHFKGINDRYGHEIGDQVLIRTASELETLVKGLGAVARIGGEEFVIVLKKMDAQAVHTVTQHLRFAIGRVNHPEMRQTSSVTASVGVALLSSGESFKMALRRADRALYQAKTSGRNQLFLAFDNQHERPVRLA